MSGRARIWRNVVAASVIGGLFVGTLLWQTDDTWPFAQMRMFPGGGESAIAIVRVDAELRNGKHSDMNPFVFHLKRAEIEGQMNRIKSKPSMLGDLVKRYNATVPRDREIVQLRLVRHESASGGRKATQTELVAWPG